jgi:hypothetical protein
MKLVAAVTIDNYTILQMHEDNLKDYVLNSLVREISNEVAKHMEINEEKDLYNDTTRYSGTITLGANSPTYGVMATSTGISAASIINAGTGTVKRNEEFRVAEYVNKNGNITRVELQRLEEDGWITIPRVKIEEL